MPNFQTHITASSIAGATYGVWGHWSLELPLTTSMLAGGLCAVAGMLPDVDSDSGIPLRETSSLMAAVTPMMMTQQFLHWGMNPESIVLASAGIYLAIRWGVAEVVRRYTVHRGMWHSMPAAAMAFLAALALCSCEQVVPRVYKAGGVLVGYLSHLVLDALHGYRPALGGRRASQALGSPLKLWRGDAWANMSTYVKLAGLVVWTLSDGPLMQHLGWQDSRAHWWSRQLFVQMGLRDVDGELAPAADPAAIHGAATGPERGLPEGGLPSARLPSATDDWWRHE